MQKRGKKEIWYSDVISVFDFDLRHTFSHISLNDLISDALKFLKVIKAKLNNSCMHQISAYK